MPEEPNLYMTEALQRNSWQLEAQVLIIVCTELRSWPALAVGKMHTNAGKLQTSWLLLGFQSFWWLTYPTHSRQLRCDAAVAAAAHHLPRFSRGSIGEISRSDVDEFDQHYEWAWWSTILICLTSESLLSLCAISLKNDKVLQGQAGVTYILITPCQIKAGCSSREIDLSWWKRLKIKSHFGWPTQKQYCNKSLSVFDHTHVLIQSGWTKSASCPLINLLHPHQSDMLDVDCTYP